MTAPRVGYREGQRLRLRDLRDEQAYRRSQRRRHRIAHHDWGIVRGLGLSIAGADDEAVLAPGLAVDGFGRQLIVPEALRMPFDVLDDARKRLEEPAPEEAVDLWLLYGLRPGGGRGFEEAILRLTPAANVAPEARSNMTTAVDVDRTELDAGTRLETPDAAHREWPVYLGRLRRRPPGYEALAVRRRYARWVGSRVLSPGGGVGIDFAGADDPGDHRFAVRVRAASGELVPRLVLGADGTNAIAGNLTVAGDLRPAGIGWTAPVTPPAKAAPAQLYRVREQVDEVRADALRAEIAHPGDEGHPADSRLSVGFFGPAGDDAGPRFRPCLSVAADRSVVVAGSLVVEGKLIEAPIRADAEDPRFAAEYARQLKLGRQAARENEQQEEEPIGLRLEKVSAAGRVTPPAGGGITRMAYAYYATNTGALALSVAVTDSDYGPIVREATVGPGETAVFYKSFELEMPPLPPGETGALATTATAVGRSDDGREVRATTTHRLVLGAEDDLELIPGLKSVFARKLEHNDLGTMEALAKAPLERLAELFPHQPRKVLKWWQQAAAAHHRAGLTTCAEIAATPLESLRELFQIYRDLGIRQWQELARKLSLERIVKGAAP